MLGNIQKRRRRSTPNSPASPTAAWQNTNTSHDLLPAAPHDSFHRTVTGSERPSLDVDVPSPKVDLSSSVTGRSKDVRTGSSVPARLSEDSTPQPSRPVVEQARPATSSSSVPRLDITYTGKQRVLSTSPLEPSFSSLRPSSSHGPESPSPDVGTKSSDRTAYANRNHSHSSLANSSPIDDTPPSKLSGGKKSRLNYLNPMSILARRRSSQNQNYLEDLNLHVKIQSVPDLPDDYDPRIRGKIIHDFSTPRPRRIQSSLDSPTFQTTSSPLPTAAPEHTRRASDFAGLRDAPPKRNSQSPKYSPVFKEHFQDDRQNLRPAQTGYLHSLALSEQQTLEANSGHVPAFAKNLPALITETPAQIAPTRAPPPPPPKEENTVEVGPEDVAAVTNTSDQNATISQTLQPGNKVPPLSSITHRVSGVPKHMTSTSSRFSFIGNGDSAAQERLLEERHKQHANNNKHLSLDTDGAQDEDDYDDYDFNADEGFEERIPGVNADESDEEDNRRISMPLHETAPNKRVSLKIDANAANDYARSASRQAFHFTPQPSALSSVSTGNNSQPTPRDEDGQIIGLANTTYSPRRPNGHHRQRSDLSIMEVSGGLAGLGFTTEQSETEPQPKVSPLGPSDHHDAFRDEDIYFDDGEFDDLMDDVNNEVVDERIFEDGSEVIRDIPAENAKKFELAYHGSSVGQGMPSVYSQSMPRLGSHALDQELFQLSQASTATNAGLTEHNLAAYHAALVSAADSAAASGRFARSVSNSYYSDTSTSQIEDSPPGLTDDKRNSNNVEFSRFDEGDGFDFDDQDDDDLIAEANAEVLENDDDGFYGQEFGFYARAKGRETSDKEYGGYFAPRGSSGVKRSHSAKANFQEPSLTPITERSEWSARNSVASLQIPGMPSSAQSVPSPGIAQLLDFDSSSFDENMSFEALMKLRRGAFGGSSSSVNSLGGGPAGSSPLAHVSAHSFGGGDAMHRMTSSMHSLTGSVGIPEDEEEEPGAWEGSTFTRNTSTKDAEVLDVQSPDSTSAFSPTSARSDKRIGHRRNSSGGESVSYVKDTDGRWLLERRRTGDDGEGEVIGREYLAGSRI